MTTKNVVRKLRGNLCRSEGGGGSFRPAPALSINQLYFCNITVLTVVNTELKSKLWCTSFVSHDKLIGVSKHKMSLR